MHPDLPILTMMGFATHGGSILKRGVNPTGKILKLKMQTVQDLTDHPKDAAGKELHLILEVWDDSDIVPLVDYRRVVLSVE